MKIDQFFQKGYYLNLDRRTDRRTQFEAEVKQNGLEGFFERIVGVDGINEPDTIRRHAYCGKSIHNTVQRIKDEGWERVLFLEDDMCFYNKGSETGLQIIEKALDQIQNFPDWEILYLGGYVFDNPAIQVSENLLKVKTVLSTHAMGLNRTVLDKILRYRPFEDAAIDGWLGGSEDIVKYFAWPIASTQRGGAGCYSDLDAWGNAPGEGAWEESYRTVLSRIVKA